MNRTDREEAESAYNYLAKTDEEYANAKACVLGKKHALKVAYSVALLEVGEGSVAVREATAYSSKRYGQALECYRNAVLDYEILEAKRQRALLAIERWRTLEATRRKTV